MKSATTTAASARAHGKVLVQASIVWQLDTRSVRARCRAEGEKPDGSGNSFVVEGCVKGSWEVITRGADPVELLRRLVRTPQVERAIDPGWRVVEKKD